MHQRLNLVEDIWALEDDKSKQCPKFKVNGHKASHWNHTLTIRFDSGWFQSSTSTFGQNTWSNVPPGCEWPPLLPPYCWQRFRMYILCCYTDYMIINIIVYDLIISSIYTRCMNMYSIWSYYLNVINANAASFHPCILVDTLMTTLHYHFVQQDSGSWWLGVCHWTVIFIATCCHWKPDSIALSWYRHLRTQENSMKLPSTVCTITIVEVVTWGSRTFSQPI